MTPLQREVVELLFQYGPQSRYRLAQRLSRDVIGISRVIRRLERKGWVEGRTEGPHDARVFRVLA